MTNPTPTPRACAFTGHRALLQAEMTRVCEALFLLIDRLYREGYTVYYCGGALGFDTVAAVTVLNMKAKYPDLRLVMALPCPEQSARWQKADRALYQSILSRADEVVTLSEHYTNYCMMKRNRYMVDHADKVIAYLKKDTGGTASTVRYAEKKGIDVINLV